MRWCGFVVFGGVLALAAVAYGDEPRGNAVDCSASPSGASLKETLALLNEADLKSLACDVTRETYRIVRHGFHLSESAASVRIEIWPTGQAAVTVRRTDVTVRLRDRPKLVFDRTRMLQADEIESFLRAIDASGFWTVNTAVDGGFSRKIVGENGEELTQTCSPPSNEITVEALRRGVYHDVMWVCFPPETFSGLLQEFTRLHRSVDK